MQLVVALRMTGRNQGATERLGLAAKPLDMASKLAGRVAHDPQGAQRIQHKPTRPQRLHFRQQGLHPFFERNLGEIEQR